MLVKKGSLIEIISEYRYSKIKLTIKFNKFY